ncbi:MAG: hypothetical protein ABI567_02565 [Gammaproteobacteria bacterium]
MKRDGDSGLVKGLYALCPDIAGEWPFAKDPSRSENNSIMLDLHNNRGTMAYGFAAFDQRDPLRDEGVDFYRLLIPNGQPARCRQVMGTIHGTEVSPMCCPDISRDTAGIP